MHAFSNAGNSFQPHCCSLPGQLGRGAQLRKVQKVILENEPREDGPFLTVHGVLKPPMTWAGTAGAGQLGQPAYRIVLMCCSFYSKSISKDIHNVGNVGLRVPREKNVGLRCWPAIVILTHPFPLASPQFQEGAKMHPGSCRCLIVQNCL